MTRVRTIQMNQSVFSSIQAEGDALRGKLKSRGTFLINVMSSPGAGKTTTLVGLIARLKKRLSLGVIEADLDSDVDAKRVSDLTGVPAIQIHTDSLCHVDCGMVEEALRGFAPWPQMLFLENVGNLLCPAEFDSGSHLNVALISVADGTEKVTNYPKLFRYVDAVLINKMDALPYFDFDYDKAAGFIRSCNPRAALLPLSAKTGIGMTEAADYFEEAYENWRK